MIELSPFNIQELQYAEKRWAILVFAGGTHQYLGGFEDCAVGIFEDEQEAESRARLQSQYYDWADGKWLR